jgi:hypothetical protein
MKALALATLAVIGLAALPSAKADYWNGSPSFWFDDATYGGFRHYGSPHSGGPYFIAGFGDDNYPGERRYWGGPYWTECSGRHPPFETYRMRCRHLVVKVAVLHRRHIRARLR